MPERATCETCKWWERGVVAVGATTGVYDGHVQIKPGEIIIEPADHGTCKRIAAWPTRKPSDYCGDHTEKE